MVTAANCYKLMFFGFFFFNDTATTEIYTLSLHDALPIYAMVHEYGMGSVTSTARAVTDANVVSDTTRRIRDEDRKSTRLNSSHANISYAVFCLKKKKNKYNLSQRTTPC